MCDEKEEEEEGEEEVTITMMIRRRTEEGICHCLGIAPSTGKRTDTFGLK
jgi:hypothetical protein